MLNLSKNFKKLFILYFTRELILHSAEGEIFQLKNLVKEQVKDEKEQLIHSIKRHISEKREKLKERDLDFYKIFKGMNLKFYPQTRTLVIPEPKLPPHLQYLKPVPRKIEIDLERLNPLIKDPAVKIIECNGPDEHIFVRGTMGVKPTNTVLGKEEINSIITKFAQMSNIPPHEGVYRVVVGRLIFSAIISEVVGSKFIIKKMFYAPTFRRQIYPNPMIR